MIFYERGLEEKSMELKINEFDLDFTEKLKFEQRGIFRKDKSQNNQK